MKMQSVLHRTLQALLITGISVFAVAPGASGTANAKAAATLDDAEGGVGEMTA